MAIKWKSVDVDGSIGKYDKRPLPQELKYAGKVDVYADWDSVVEAEKVPDKDAMLTMVNEAIIANERQKLLTAELKKASEAFLKDPANVDEDGKLRDGVENPYVKRTLADSEDLRIERVVESIMSGKKKPPTREAAIVMARQVLGLDD